MKVVSLRWLGAPAVGLVLWFVGCLNPRPEDFPSGQATDSPVASPGLQGGGTGSDPDDDGAYGNIDGQAAGGSTSGVPPTAPGPNFAADAGVEIPALDAGPDAQ